MKSTRNPNSTSIGECDEAAVSQDVRNLDVSNLIEILENSKNSLENSKSVTDIYIFYDFMTKLGTLDKLNFALINVGKIFWKWNFYVF